MFHSFCIIQTDAKLRREYVERQLGQFSIKPVDVCLLDAPRITIENIRSVITFLSRKPYSSAYKAVLIEADGLTAEAQQAFLKTLEEPPAYAFLYLNVSHPDLLLPTILSRCQLITLGQNSTPQLAQSEILSLSAFWGQILHSSLGNRLTNTQEIARSREEVLLWIEKQVVFWQQRLHEAYGSTPVPALSPIVITAILRELTQTHSLVERNISLKLAVDHLLLGLPLFKKPN